MTKTSAGQSPQNLATHRFDTSGYVDLGSGTRREASSGRMIATEKADKPKK